MSELARAVFAAVYALAGAGKLIDPGRSARAMRALAIAELTLAVMLISPAASLVLWPATILAGSFAAYSLMRLLRRSGGSCHCFGALGSDGIASAAARNAILLAAISLLHGESTLRHRWSSATEILLGTSLVVCYLLVANLRAVLRGAAIADTSAP